MGEMWEVGVGVYLCKRVWLFKTVITCFFVMVFLSKRGFGQSTKKSENSQNQRVCRLNLRFVWGVVVIERKACTAFRRARYIICDQED